MLRSPGLAETLPPSGLASLAAPLQRHEANSAAVPDESSHVTEPANVALQQLDRLSALVDREARKSGPTPAIAEASAPATSQWEAIRDSSNEEPLEAYLDRFMERLVGKKNEAPKKMEQTVPTATSVMSMPMHATQPVPQPAGVLALPSPPREPVKAPECRATMSAMRELANQNARSAVAHYATANLSGRARLALVVAAGMSLTSSGLAAAAIAINSAGCLWGAVVAGIVAAVPACRFFLLCRQFQATNGVVGEV